MKKILVFIVALAMVMSMAVPAFADEKYGAGWTIIHGLDLNLVESSIFVYEANDEGNQGTYYGSFVRNPQGNSKKYGGLQLVGHCLKGEVIISTVKGTYTASLVERGNGNATNNPYTGTDNYWIEGLKEAETPVEPPIEETYNLIYDQNTEDLEEVVGNMPDNRGGLASGEYELSEKNPERRGFDFKGWGETPDSKVPLSKVTIADNSIWVYAIWERDVEDPEPGLYNLRFHENFAQTDVDKVSGMPQNMTGKAGTTQSFYVTPMREGYTFEGWRINPLEGEFINNVTFVDEDIDVYAIWSANPELPTEKYSIEYIANLPTGVSPKTMPDNQINLAPGTYDLGTATADGYTFIGWSMEQDGKTAVDQVEIINQTITVYGIWTKDEPLIPPVINYMSLTYDANFIPTMEDFVVGMPSNVKNKEFGNVVILTGTPTREGYTFKGWSLDRAGTQMVSDVTFAFNDIEVYAIWEQGEKDPGEGDHESEPPKDGEDTDPGENNKTTNPEQPKTDDTSNLQLYALMTISAMGALYVVWRKKEDEQ